MANQKTPTDVIILVNKKKKKLKRCRGTENLFFSLFEDTESKNDLTFSWLATILAILKYLIFDWFGLLGFMA